MPKPLKTCNGKPRPTHLPKNGSDLLVRPLCPSARCRASPHVSRQALELLFKALDGATRRRSTLPADGETDSDGRGREGNKHVKEHEATNQLLLFFICVRPKGGIEITWVFFPENDFLV